jgi:hypothetical protein
LLVREVILISEAFALHSSRTDFAVMAQEAVVAPLHVPGDKRSGRPPLGFRFGCKLEPDIIVMPSCARSTIPSGTSLTLS